MNQDYRLIKQHFDMASENEQRGNTTEAGMVAYATYLLERIQPPSDAALLEIGCGDGLPMRKLRELRPDLNIDGIDLSTTLSKAAKVNNPNSLIIEGNVLEIDLPNRRYDVIYSFSFMQYIRFHDILKLHKRLVPLLQHGGRIVHCSIPDRRLKAVYQAEDQFRKHLWHGWWRTPLLCAWQSIFNGDRYGEGGFWHDPQSIVKLLDPFGSVEVLPGDIYYRFDLNARF